MSKPLRILFIEDSEEDVQLELRELRRGGYHPVYERVESPDAMAAALDGAGAWDIVVSDHSMPHFSAPDALELLREQKLDLPFIVVSGRMSEDLAVAIMKAGAHDYVSKSNLARLVPVVTRELRDARVRRQRKRAEEELKRSFAKLKIALEGTVKALAMATEKRDPYTAGHQERVTELACAIAKEMGSSSDQIDEIRLAGTLHDIGKLYVPAEILTKPGRLTEQEFSMMKVHPQVGYDILKEAQLPCSVAKAVFQHHERKDGSGYPSGLAGDKITIEARILAVADVVEAMASHRPYRPALGIEKALDEIAKNKGVLYDARAADACLTLFHKKGFKLQ